MIKHKHQFIVVGGVIFCIHCFRDAEKALDKDMKRLWNNQTKCKKCGSYHLWKRRNHEQNRED